MLKTFYVGVKGVIKAGDKVLLMKKEGQDGKLFWDIPGGRIDDTESIEQALRREMSEEVPAMKAYTVGDLISAYRLEKDLNDGNGLMLLFYAIEAEPFEVVLSKEHTAYRWFSLEDLSYITRDVITISPGYLEAARRVFENR